MNRKTPLLIAVLASMAVSAHAQNLVTNPGFETGDFTAWTLSDPYLCSVNGHNVHSGTFSAALGTTSSYGYLNQTITTVVGQSYHVDFWLDCGGSEFHPDSNAFSASFAGVNLLSLFDTFAFPYYHVSGTVTATSTSSLLQFAFSFPHQLFSASVWFLDDVSVTPPVPALQLSAAVPTKRMELRETSISTCRLRASLASNAAVAARAVITRSSLPSLTTS